MRPSRKRDQRGSDAAIVASCVMTTIVEPEWCNVWRRSSTSLPVAIEIAGRFVGEHDCRIADDRERSRPADARRPRAATADGSRGGPDRRAATRARRGGDVRGPILRGRATPSPRCRVRSALRADGTVGTRSRSIRPAQRRELFVAKAHEAAPAMRTSPDVGRSSAPTMFNSVDFPEPEGPTTATISPRSMRKRMLSSPRTGGEPGYSLTTSSSSRTAVVADVSLLRSRSTLIPRRPLRRRT